MNDVPRLSVSQLTQQIKFSLGELFPQVWVQGEISDLTKASSGHWYFSLKDDQARLACVMWRSAVSRVKLAVEEGQEVLVQGGIDVYPPRGSYQLTVQRMQGLGIGGLQLAFQRLHRKMAEAGWFNPEHKQNLPKIPRLIGVVTSPDGAAIRDFLQVLTRRWANVEVLVIPTLVQGPGAEHSIAKAIRTAARLRNRPDVLVVCRGGGSAEDLWCFNEEIVCRAVFESPIPVVSAIGHEVDVTLCDLVADVRALTPSEAAELVVPAGTELQQQLDETRTRLQNALLNRWRAAQQAWRALAERPVFRQPLLTLEFQRQRLDELERRCVQGVRQACDWKRAELSRISDKLSALSPLSILSRGYSVTSRAESGVVRDFQQLRIGDILETRLQGGRVWSEVREIAAERPDGTGQAPQGH